MTTVDLATAQQRLPELTDAVAHGDEVIITRADGTAFRLVLLPMGIPQFGSATGQVILRDDFDDPLPGFEAYQP